MSRSVSEPRTLGDGAGGAQREAAPIWVRFLHLAALTALAIAQPLYDLLSRAPEFFVAHRSGPGDILLLALVVSLLVPLVGTALQWGAGLFSKRLAGVLHLLFVIALCVLLVLGVIRNLEGVGSFVIVALALSSSVLMGFFYWWSSKLRSFVTLLSATAVVFPALFLLRPPVARLVFEPAPERTASVRSESTTPLVFIIFDDLPLSSLLRSDGEINDRLYPSFASLAEGSDWFVNATTVASATSQAVPALLTGQYPRSQPSGAPPESLFTLASPSHEPVVFEQSMSHCSEDVCADPTRRMTDAARLRFLLSDVMAIYQHLLWPAPARENLPPVDLAWGGFRGGVDDRLRPTDTVAFIERFIDSIDRGGRPPLYYFHPNIPHWPWKHLASGREYGPRSIPYRPFGMIGSDKIWSTDEHYAAQGWQRHLLQVGFADRVLGRIIDKLKSEGLFEEAFFVLCSDHGSSYIAGEYHRRKTLAQANAADVLSVPLFVKRPQQTTGRRRPEQVEIIDILPTVADLLEVPLPWEVDGRSFLADGVVTRETKTAFDRKLNRLEYPANSLHNASTVERKVEIFGEEPEGLFAFGPLKDLVGRHVNEFEHRFALGLTAEIHDELEYQQVASGGDFVPAFIVGRLLYDQSLPLATDLAVAVNGTVRAGAKLTPVSPGEGRFAALVPEESFVPGRNAVDVLVVDRGSSGITLTRAARPEAETYFLEATEIRGSAGGSWEFGASSLRGTVGRKNWDLLGWAADQEELDPAERILVFVDGAFVLSAPVEERSPGLHRRHGVALARSGFRFMIPFSRIPRGASVRVFALAGHSAAELRYAETFRLDEPQTEAKEMGFP